MSRRFLVLVKSRPGAAADLAAKLMSCLLADDALELVHDRGRLMIFASPGFAVDINPDCILLGSLFQRGSSERVAALPKSDRVSAVATRGLDLLDSCWGSYVAILDHPEGRIDIIRAPFAETSCYYVEHGNATIVASDVTALTACGCYAPIVDWEAIARKLAWHDVRRPETCLSGCRELLGGYRLSLGDHSRTIEPIWSPWKFAAPTRQIGDPEEAKRRVRDSTAAVVAARASEFEHVLLMLSGGTDSSIVAACLAKQPRPFSCINLVTQDAAGDERSYARAAAAAVGCPLSERFREVAGVDITHSPARHLPRPSLRSFTQESTRISHQIARAVGATAIFNGGGGDNIFCSLQSASPAADRLLTTGFTGAFWKTVSDISRLAPASLSAVTIAAVKRAWWRGPAFRVPEDRSFLSSTAIGWLGDIPDDPWLQPPQAMLPGKAAHVALLAFAQNFLDAGETGDDVQTIAPLLSQPLVETCLRVPSWLWFDGGRNRVIARRAFAAQLPPEIVRRTSKGSPNSFSAEIFEANADALREMLLHGALARHDVLDTEALRRAFDDPRRTYGQLFNRLLQLADVEAWARSWTDFTAQCAPAHSIS